MWNKYGLETTWLPDNICCHNYYNSEMKVNLIDTANELWQKKWLLADQRSNKIWFHYLKIKDEILNDRKIIPTEDKKVSTINTLEVHF